jgi:hypothetical protein
MEEREKDQDAVRLGRKRWVGKLAADRSAHGRLMSMRRWAKKRAKGKSKPADNSP